MAASEADVPEKSTSSTAAPAPSLKIRDDWYQTETHVVINILVKNMKNEDVSVSFTEQTVSVDLKLPDNHKCLVYNLSHPVVPGHSSYKILSSKIEVKLKKAADTRWQKLESEATPTADPGPQVSEGSTLPKEKNWDKVVVALGETEEDKPQGEAALNALFQQIYGEGSDEVRKAMEKSFVESGGTVLSTVWKDVKGKKVEIKPPDGVEYRKWDE